MAPDDFPYVRAWGRYLGLTSEEIFASVRRARSDLAPADACWFSEDLGGWVTRAAVVGKAHTSDLYRYSLGKLDEYAGAPD